MTHTEPATREEQLQRENTTLRAIVAKIMPCHYCGVDDIAKCPAGFPGCDLADDISAYDSLVWTEYRALKQRLASEPAGPVTTRQIAETCAVAIQRYHDDFANPAVAIKGSLLDYLTPSILALLAASTGARGAVVEEIAKRHEQARREAILAVMPDGTENYCFDFQWRIKHANAAFDDRATLLALIGAKQP